MTLRQTHPVETDVPETPTEDALRALYPHPPGMVRLGMIAGVRGEATGAEGSSRSLSGPPDLRVLRVLRAAADVVLVGAATVRREHYGAIVVRDALARTREADQAREPVVAVVSFLGAIPEALGPGNALLMTTASAPAFSLASTWRESLIVAGDDVFSPTAAIKALRERGLTRALCEGGPALARLLLDDGVVDDYCLTTSPLRGGEHSPLVPAPPSSLSLMHTLEGDGFTMRRWGTPRG